ncbi:Uncharacterised protein [Neisseria meningitidis]|nr:hypothetical protein A6J49_00815 [Neisseria meningitidis]ELK56326.1 hypothetical protein NMNM422_2085 [Neisseria meningitidis NM422]ELK75976.1 hypothetical protein NMM13255_2058 [Neisseria meningitidis M13255]ELK94184.1 hypothetical protein NM9757_2002 [Neisseria meningitidis 9757]ELK99990.1 hypothetical protein NM12888_2082 [Neisseria meningitidis 12888]
MTAEWFQLLSINAAISSLVIPLKQKTEIRNLKSRHSRAGGNLGLSAQKLVGKNGFFRFYVLDSRLRGNDDEKIVVASDKFLSRWVLDSRFRGNDGRVVSVAPDKCRHLKSRHSLKTENRNQKPKIPSFPRRRESRFVGAETC